MAPMQEPWHGLSVYGAVTRHVADTALFLDATGDGEPLAPAVGRDPGKLRIATSTPSCRRSSPRRTASSRARSTTCASCSRALGHDVGGAEIPYGTTGVAFTARYFARHRRRGGQAAASRAPLAPHQGLPPPGQRDPARRAASAPAPRRPPTRARSPRVFEHADVLMTPMFTKRPIPIGTYEGRGALWSFNGYSRWVPYCAPFNHTGQPAASVPAGFTDDGFPLAVQLVGRPATRRRSSRSPPRSRPRGRGRTACPPL